MAFPVILVDSATGSDTQASGAGPSTALFGTTDASTDAGGTVVTLTAATDLTNVATDGSHVIYLADSTAGNRNFGKITAKAGSGGATPTVTVSDAFGASLSGKSWAIGGKLASIGSSTSIKLFTNNSAAGDAMPGWTVEMQSGHTETLSGSFDARRSGDTTDGPITLRGAAGGTRPIITFSNNGNGIVVRGSGQVFQFFEMRNANASKTSSIAITSGSAGPALVRDVKVSHSTDYFRRAFVSNMSGYEFVDCEVGYCGNVGIDISAMGIVQNCWIHDCASHGMLFGGSAAVAIIGNIFAFNGGDGANVTMNSATVHSPSVWMHNTFHGNADAGVEFTAAVTSLARPALAVFDNNQFTRNGGYGLNFSGASVSNASLQCLLFRCRNNNFASNTSGKYNPTLTNENETTNDPSGGLTSATKDYAGTTGGSDFRIVAASKATGYPLGGTLAVGSTSSTYSYVDPGAAQRREFSARARALIGM